jgi:hypothetical protein
MERACLRSMVGLVVLGSPLIVLAALLGDPRINSYVGLSGLATGAVAWLAIRWIRAGPNRGIGWAIAGGLLIKIAWEVGGAEPRTLAGTAGEVRVAEWAHAAGAAAGLGIAAAGSWISKKPSGRA